MITTIPSNPPAEIALFEQTVNALYDRVVRDVLDRAPYTMQN